jgi:hypothetical protein
LAEVGREVEALAQIEGELAVRPDDVSLLNQKLLVLRQLRGRDPKYEDPALEFAEFRAEALPGDFLGLSEIAAIRQSRCQSEAVWPFIDKNLRCDPYRVSQLAADATIDLSDFAAGFTYAALYRQYCMKFPLEDHCVTLHQYGLSPDTALIRPLIFALLPVFGMAAQTLDPTNGPLDAEKLNGASNRAVATMSRIFPLFGTKWLTTKEPKDVGDKQRLLTVGMCYLIDTVAAETGRQIGFLRGCYGITHENIFPIGHSEWAELGSQIATDLFQRVVQEWDMLLPADPIR